MRIALISPYSHGSLRGNIITVERIARFLKLAGAKIVIMPTDRLSPQTMELMLAEFKPDLIHGFHARHCGVLATSLANQNQLPSVITITGSDVHDPLIRNHPDTAMAFSAAHAITCFSSLETGVLAHYFPDLKTRTVIISQGVEALPVSGKKNFGLAKKDFVLLLPAALRPVKQIEFPVLALARLAGQLPELRLVIAGGIIDSNYAETVRTIAGNDPFVRWLGEVPHEYMGDLYHRADLVVNCSTSESMPNSLMEAMALGRPILAADIPGNRSLVRNGENGCFFYNEDDFREKVLCLKNNCDLRKKYGERARLDMQTNFSPRQEAENYLELYRSLL